jgi:hypothetical protein
MSPSNRKQNTGICDRHITVLTENAYLQKIDRRTTSLGSAIVPTSEISMDTQAGIIARYTKYKSGVVTSVSQVTA